MNIYFIGQSGRPNWFGVGETKGDLMIQTHGIPRKGADYNKARDALVEYTEVAFWKGVKIRDKRIHKWLETVPFITKVGTESFEFDSNHLDLEMIRSMIQDKFFTDTPPVRRVLNLKPYQKKFVAKAQAEYLDFLLAAKCRAGKSVMVLSHIKDKGHKVSLVVSRFNSPFSSWVDDIKTFDVFSNFITINLKDSEWFSSLNYWLSTNRQIIIYGTVQTTINRVEDILSVTNLDLLVFDESHVGEKGNQFITLRETLSETPCMKVSGTAFEELMNTSDNNRFVYDYYQEQLDSDRGVFETPRPKMKVVLVNYESEEVRDVYGDDPDSMKNLFMVRDGKFVDHSSVVSFVSKYFADNRRVKPQNTLFHKSHHMFMALPSVDACKLLKEVLDPIIPTLVVTGDSKKTQSDINKFVAENDAMAQKSICLTVEANVLGVTEEKWDTIINCKGGESIKFWVQFAFRGGSGVNNWTVVDFEANRALVSIRDIFTLSNDLTPIPAKYTHLDFAPIFEFNDGFTEMTQERINQILSSKLGNVVQLMTGLTRLVDSNKLNDFEFNNYLDYDDSDSHKREFINGDDNLNGEIAKRRINETNEPTETDLEEKKKTLKRMLQLISIVILRDCSIGKQPSNIDDVIQSPIYPGVTGDTSGEMERFMDEGLIRKSVLSNRVMMTSSWASTQLVDNPLSKILTFLNVTTGVQKMIPTGLFDNMVEETI